MNTTRFFAMTAGAVLLGLGLGEAPAAAQSVSPAVAQAQGQLVWTDQNGRPTDAALILVDFLRRADEHALPASKYRGNELAARLRSGGAGLESELTRAFVAYAQDVSAGVLSPQDVDEALHIDVRRPDPRALLAGAAQAGNMAAYLDSLSPQDSLYRRLVERYRSFRSVAGNEIWGPKIGGGGVLRLGDRSPRVAQARARLTAMGDLDPNVYANQAEQADGVLLASASVITDAPVARFDPDYFDQPLEDALKRFQARHGLNQDGLIGPATLAQLNISPRERADQLAVNLERQRWLNHQLSDRYVLVNMAGFEMWVMENGRPVFQSRVINGEAGRWETPEFSETMTHMVVNPTWYVPMSIARAKILPRLQEDPTYLAKQGMRLVGADAEAEHIDWDSITPETFPGRVTQLPGDANALGLVKFMFPNPHSVYLHDTPGKHLFEKDVRAFSHGCVRVEKAYELAAYLLQDQKRNPAAYFEEVVASGKEQRIELERPLPVILTYRTAWIDENGVEQFRGDVYERDQVVASALQSAGVRILR